MSVFPASDTMGANQDGVIDRNEFAAAMVGGAPQEPIAEPIAMPGVMHMSAQPMPATMSQSGPIFTQAAPVYALNSQQPMTYATPLPPQPFHTYAAPPAQAPMTVCGPSTLEIQNITVTGGKISRSGILDKADPYVYFTIKDGGAVCIGKTTTKKKTTSVPAGLVKP
jgi:hypothetical protein